MKLLFILTLLTSVFSGLLVQETAIAASPAAIENAIGINPQDCMEMMQQGPSDDSQPPCDCSHCDCAAMMGGASPLYQPRSPLLAAAPHSLRTAHDLSVVPPLTSQDIAPIPEPPIRLI